MTVEEITAQLRQYQAAGKKMFVTSSFQTHSIPLLHILSRVKDVEIDVLFINTGFHFPETIVFRDEIAALLGIEVIDVHSLVPKNLQKDAEGDFYFISDPDYCCYLNKVQPLEPYLQQYDIWINGVRADQSDTRKQMKVEQPAPFHTTRFHPMLDWNAKRIWEYRKEHQLPEHPLDQKGYQSIGCFPCTKKFDDMDERTARWFGLNKTECGLHTELISK
jgi:phosphoadenosine phosphosulfate reductase